MAGYKRIPAGERIHQLEFQRRNVARDEMGLEVPGEWTLITRTRAKILHGTGNERREAAGERATIAATFMVNSSPALRTVTEEDRFLWDGQPWDIHSIAPIGRNVRIDFTATAGKA
jgi:head-tail adaptor